MGRKKVDGAGRVNKTNLWKEKEELELKGEESERVLTTLSSNFTVKQM